MLLVDWHRVAASGTANGTIMARRPRRSPECRVTASQQWAIRKTRTTDAAGLGDRGSASWSEGRRRWLDIRVDQPRQHRRITVIDQLTVGGRIVRRRLHPDNATVLDEDSAADRTEIFTIEDMVCTNREHTAWLPNPSMAVNAIPMPRCPTRRLTGEPC